MYKLNEVVPDYETRGKILSQIPSYPHEPGMSNFDSAFLCGLLKMAKPKKIVEIGVAGGATTAIILQCLEDIAMPYEMYSIDISETVWHTQTLKTGAIAEYAKEILTPNHHELLIGAGVTSFLDRIGDDIDFVILDTVHRIPGEILDFLAIFPYLKDGAMVCLHDLMTSQYGRTSMPATYDYYATTILFNSVTADKYLNFDESRDIAILPNIGAFSVTNETKRDIYSVFFSLLIPWSYIPANKQLEEYDFLYCKNYDEVSCKIWKQAISVNLYNMTIFEKLIKKLANKKIALWGAGNRGKVLWEKLKEAHFQEHLVTWIDTNANILNNVDGKELLTPDEIDWKEAFEYIVITPSSKIIKKEIKDFLAVKGIDNRIILNY